MLTWPSDADAICDAIVAAPTDIKFVLKTRNEADRLDRWISHHLPIAGPDGLVVFDNGSTDHDVDAVRDRYADRVQFHGWNLQHDAVHDATRQQPLYAAVRASCRHYAFLDTDERAFWSEGSRLLSGVEFAARLADDDAGRLVHPGLWLENRPGSIDIYFVAEARLARCLGWGKPLFGCGVDVRGFVNHNWQFVRENPGHELWSGFVVCHDRFDDAARRLRSNVEKCLAYGFAATAEEIERIIATGRFENYNPAFQNYLREIVRCRTESWTPASDPRADQVAVRAGGVLQFGSPEAESCFREYAGARLISESEIREL
jgi:hypothetical protein